MAIKISGNNIIDDNRNLVNVATINAGTTIKAQGGSEGGEIYLEKPASGSILSGNVVIDVAQNFFRVFEFGSPNRGLIANLASLGSQSRILTEADGTFTGRLLRAPTILTSGTSYTTPAQCKNIYVECVGGGGGGGSASGTANSPTGAGGGGSGAYCAGYFSVSAGQAISYAIGAGGGPGVAGGATTFAGTLSAGGGSGVTSGESDGAAGGTATGGSLNVPGTPGGSGSDIASGFAVSGFGGSSFFGGGGGSKRDQGSTTAGINGQFGGGGSGTADASTSVGTGGTGGSGVIRIWEFG